MRRIYVVLWAAALGVLTASGSHVSPRVAHGQGPAPTHDAQAVLGPGLYVFQTRTRTSTCGDAERDGYVLSYFAAINGIPGCAEMAMDLVNTPHFSSWLLAVSPNGTLTGRARIGSAADGPEAHISVKLEGDRWTGTGGRSYKGTLNGKPTRCRVEYDALLRRIDAP